MFKISCFILFLSVFFMSFFSYGQGEDFLSGSSLKNEQALEQPDSEAPSLELSKGVNDVLNPVGKYSVLSIKGEGLIVGSLFLSNVTPVPSVSLELQTPFKTKDKLKWLFQVGGFVTKGVSSLKDEDVVFNVCASVDAGLRYDFQPWASSFILGAYVTPHTFSADRWAVHPIAVHIKWALSIERKFTNVSVGLTGGAFAVIISPFIGLSVRYPLRTW